MKAQNKINHTLCDQLDTAVVTCDACAPNLYP